MQSRRYDYKEMNADARLNKYLREKSWWQDKTERKWREEHWVRSGIEKITAILIWIFAAVTILSCMMAMPIDMPGGPRTIKLFCITISPFLVWLLVKYREPTYPLYDAELEAQYRRWLDEFMRALDRAGI